MKEYIPYIPAGGLFVICVALIKMLNGRLKNKVNRGECHDAQKSVMNKINDLDKHIDRRFDTLERHLNKKDK